MICKFYFLNFQDENRVNVVDHPAVTSLSTKAIIKQSKSVMRKKKDDSSTGDIEEIASSSEESDVVEKRPKNATNRKNGADNGEENNNDMADSTRKSRYCNCLIFLRKAPNTSF